MELCMLHTTPYHSQANGIVERNNRLLGDSLKALLLRRGQNEHDRLLPQLMRAYRTAPHSATGETANLMMFRCVLRLPDQLQDYPPPIQCEFAHECVTTTKDRLDLAHEELRQLQIRIRQRTVKNVHCLLWEMWCGWRTDAGKGASPKLQPKFVEPYNIKRVFENHT